MTPLQSVGQQEWLEKKMLNRAYAMCYDALILIEQLKNSDFEHEVKDWESFGMVEAYANEILLIRELMNEDG